MNRFSINVQELGVRYTEEGEKLLPCFRAIIYDNIDGWNPPHPYQVALQSPVWEEGDIRGRRFTLPCLYKMIGYTLQRRQFPNDTKIYDTEQTEHGLKWINGRYPDSGSEKTCKTVTTNAE